MSGILAATLGSLSSGITVATNPVVSIKTAGTNNLSQTVSVTAGDLLIVMLAFDPSGASIPSVTISDGGINTYTSASAGNYAAPATTSAGTGVLTTVFKTIASTSGSITITPTFASSITAKAMSVIEVSKCTATLRNPLTAARGTVAAGPTLTTPSANAKDLILAVCGREQPNTVTITGDSDTTNGAWSSIVRGGTTGGSAATNILLAYQYKVVTATGTQSWAITSSAASNWGAMAFAFAAA